MLSFVRYLKLMDDYSEEKLNNKIICAWYGDTWIIFLIVIFFNDFLFSLLRNYYMMYVFIYGIILIWMVVYLITRKAGLGISNNRLVFVKFKHLGVRINRFEEIPFEKIRNINIRTFMGTRIVFISYISSSGKLEKIRVYYANKYIGFDSDEVIKNRKEITNKLLDMQKVLDRGDF